MGNVNRYIILMAGGSGERFWPMSRSSRPKHLVPIVGESPMLAQTVERALKLVPADHIFIITHHEQKEGVLQVCPKIKPENIIAEPMRCNTAAVVGLASVLVRKFNSRSVFSVWPADAAIHNVSAFAECMENAFLASESMPCWVTLGVQPTYAATGYGYIERGEEIAAGSQVFRVLRFVEKPDAEKARCYLSSGCFFWNAGIFTVAAETALRDIQRFIPELYSGLMDLEKEWSSLTALESLLGRYYPLFPKVSVDYAILEKTDNVCVLPTEFDWDDVGEWTTLARHYPADKDGNIIRGEVFIEGAKQNIIVNETHDHLIGVLGLSDVIVVHTTDATLICPKEKAQQVKNLLQKLPAKYR